MATTYLTTVIGWYMVIFSLLMLFRQKHLKLVMADLVAHRGLFFILALITFFLGLLIVTSHNIWVMGWPVVITIFGWLVLINGLFRLFFPDIATKLGRNLFTSPYKINIAAIIFLIFGLYLLLHAYNFHM